MTITTTVHCNLILKCDQDICSILVESEYQRSLYLLDLIFTKMIWFLRAGRIVPILLIFMSVVAGYISLYMFWKFRTSTHEINFFDVPILSVAIQNAPGSYWFIICTTVIFLLWNVSTCLVVIHVEAHRQEKWGTNNVRGTK